MAQIPIISGIYTDAGADFRISYPTNLEPVIVDSGISKGYLRTVAGITGTSTGPGADRGGTLFKGKQYRVMGSSLCTVSDTGTIAVVGDVDFGGPVSFAQSFDLLAIASGGKLFYWDGSTVAQVTDPDLGLVIDVIWIDGFFMTTDGTSLVVTELNDPWSVDPLKYGSSEVSPDPVTGLLALRGEVYALNRTTIENFRNSGSSGFPFVRQSGALIPKGCVGTFASAYILQTFAFIGGDVNEGVSVYLAGAGQAIPISTPEIDMELGRLTEEQLAAIEVESRRDRDEERLLIHLPSVTLVWLANASKVSGEQIWHRLAAGTGGDQPYLNRHATLLNDRWWVGNPAGQLGYLDYGVETQFGAVAGWEFQTAFVYNESRGAIFKSTELVGLPGRAPFGVDATCFFAYTLDGQTWSEERANPMGQRGERNIRMQWRPMFRMSNYAGFRFRGANTSMAAWARLEADIEALSV